MPVCETQLRLPAEWEPQGGVVLTWPHERGAWAGMLDEVEPVFLAIATAIGQRENLLINTADANQAASVRRALIEQGLPAERLFVACTPSDDTWARDHGPLSVATPEGPRLIDFRFNGWGEKYPSDDDNAINRTLADRGWFGKTPVQSIDMVLEGGSIDTDGCGTLLTTSSCLLHPRRNPALSRADIEDSLRRLLGAERVLWLGHGCIEGDDTDGHIDMLARFADPRTIVYQRCDDPGYGCYASLQAMEAELGALRDREGRPYRLVPLPWPQAKIDPDGNRMPASYANFLLINGAVLMPTYADPADAGAARQLRDCFPHRELVAIDCLPVIRQHGSLHCLTMQLPAGIQLQLGR